MKLPAEVQPVCHDFLAGLQGILGAKLYALYIFGALSFPESGSTGDIDFHVILAQALTDQERTEIISLQAGLAHTFPPLGAELDGYYLLLADARCASPPETQLHPGIFDNSYALHRAHLRAGRCIVLHGPSPCDIYPEPTWSEVEDALQDELDYVHEKLDVYQAYCILNLCRLMYSFTTHDVVTSKATAAQWACDRYPQWRELIEAARMSYAQQTTSQDRALMREQVVNFFHFAYERIHDARCC